MFTTGFDSYVCPNDKITCTVDGFDVTATVHYDDHQDPPWEREDGHGPVSEWTTRPKKPGERILSMDYPYRRYYDFAEAIHTARKEGWSAPDTPPDLTPRQRALLAVLHDFQVLKAWCEDEWFYVGIVLSVARAGITLDDHAAALWGIECNYPGSDNSYLLEVANELLPEALDHAKTLLKKLCEGVES